MRKLAQSVPGFELSGCFKLVFASYFCSIFIIDCGVDGCRIYKGADWYPFHLGRGIGWSPKGVHTKIYTLTFTHFYPRASKVATIFIPKPISTIKFACSRPLKTCVVCKKQCKY
jgi:hypothetical protein